MRLSTASISYSGAIINSQEMGKLGGRAPAWNFRFSLFLPIPAQEKAAAQAKNADDVIHSQQAAEVSDTTPPQRENTDSIGCWSGLLSWNGSAEAQGMSLSVGWSTSNGPNGRIAVKCYRDIQGSPMSPTDDVRGGFIRSQCCLMSRRHQL